MVAAIPRLDGHLPGPTQVRTLAPSAARSVPAIAPRPLLTPVVLQAIPARRARYGLPLLGVAILACFGVVAGIEVRPQVLAGATLARPAAPVSPAAGVDASALGVCLNNPTWAPPSTDQQAEHLQSDARYRLLDPVPAPERVHVELGPYRSASAFGDFVQLSGLWTLGSSLGSASCSPDLAGKAELWGLALQFQGVKRQGAELTVVAEPRPNGVEVVQIVLPSGAEALHLVDSAGAKLAPDVSLPA